MPPAPKQTTKKPGAPKAKGAVRAKSGCYTCRIRRKKCDEQQNAEGHCETCVRLRLQCLGFGAKRPEWLRESRNVAEMRDKIKAFLAAQGMIKGHSGTSHRGAEQTPVLQLDEDSTPASSVSPPTPTLTLSPAEPPRAYLQPDSAIRDQHWGYNPHVFNNMRGGSPLDGQSHTSHHADMYPTPYNSPGSLAWTHHPHSISRLLGSEVHPRAMSRLAPTIASTFGDLYHINNDSFYHMLVDEEIPSGDYSLPCFYTLPSKSEYIDNLLQHYLSKVMDLQYLLGDPIEVRSILTPTIARSSVARDAAQLLARIHRQRSHWQAENFVALQDEETKDRYNKLLEVLQKQKHTEDDAMASISIISSFLFDGGGGEWEPWLKVSYQYAQTVFGNRDPRETLANCNNTTRFIIKAAIWFDVLAAVTTQESPRFLKYIRALYSPEASGIYDPSDASLSMMTVMGCENHVVWALAEASALAVWKREQLAKGTLSVPDLVSRASNLDSNYLNASPPTPPYDMVQEDTQLARELSNNIFRAATRVYVRSIVSGDFPHVPEIVEAVNETMEYLRTPEQHPKIHSSVVRSTVFGFFICGALTDDEQTRREVKESLGLSREDASQSTVGNSHSIRRLLDEIWKERRRKNSPLEWRTKLKKANILLV